MNVTNRDAILRLTQSIKDSCSDLLLLANQGKGKTSVQALEEMLGSIKNDIDDLENLSIMEDFSNKF